MGSSSADSDSDSDSGQSQPTTLDMNATDRSTESESDRNNLEASDPDDDWDNASVHIDSRLVDQDNDEGDDEDTLATTTQVPEPLEPIAGMSSGSSYHSASDCLYSVSHTCFQWPAGSYNGTET